MEITSGRLRGMTGRLRQFANSWMTVDIEGERPNTIVSPNQVQLNDEEIARVRGAKTDHLGIFWQLWELYDDGTFVARDHGRPITLRVTGRRTKRWDER